MPISQTKSYFKNPYYPFLEEAMLLLLNLKWNRSKKSFTCVKAQTNSNFAINLAEMLKEATINFFLFDESHFSNICTL